MRLTYLSFAVSALIPGALAIFGSFRVNGQTKLFGNQFGVLAQNATYDYVVIGGGTAGLTIASRLAESPNVTVAVIEAGGFYELDNGNISQVPGYGSKYLSFNDLTPGPSLVDWGLITEPQPTIWGLSGRRIHYTAGKTLGGSSALNDMVFHRATKGSFQLWADQVGDGIFTWDKFLPYLEKPVAFTPPKNKSISYDPSVYSKKGGPLHASYPNYINAFDSNMKTAMEADSLNQGLSLTVYLRTMAKRILFSGDKTATGVLVETNGADYVISASKEVIVSAGVFHSPQILMVSGLGPAAALQGKGIPVVADLPGVGQNMWDHLFIFTSFEVNVTTLSGVLTNPSTHAEAVEAYLNEQDGPLTGIGGGIVGFEKLPNRTALSPAARADLATFPDDWPELEYLSLSPGANPADKPLANNYVSFTTAVQTIFSRGNVTISSDNTSDPPLVNVNALSTETEAEIAVAAIKRLRAMAAASGALVAEVLPGSDVVTDAQILDWVRGHAVNGYHASSTCAMGKKNDTAAVVDVRGRVYGVKGLRVVDVSIFPLLPPGHPMNTIYALAELVAEDILS